MDYRTSNQLSGLARLTITLSCIVMAMILLWLVIAESSTASAQIQDQGFSSQKPLVTSPSTIGIEFYYSGDDPEGASIAAANFTNLLSEETGLNMNSKIQFCEGFIIEHLGDGQADIATVSSMAYVLGHDKYGIEAELVNGMSGAYEYRSQINVRSSSGFNNIWDLQDTQFATNNPGSVTGFMLPYLLISETTGMTPTTFFSEIDFVGSHSQVIREVYTGAVDCGATFDDARGALSSEYPDVFDVVSVLSYTEYMPHSPWVFRQGIDENLVLTLTNGIIAVAGTTEGKFALDTIFGYDLTGIKTTQDSAYNIVRDIVNAFMIQIDPCNPIYLPSVLNN